MLKMGTMFGLLNWFFTPVKLYGGDGDSGDTGGYGGGDGGLGAAGLGGYGSGGLSGDFGGFDSSGNAFGGGGDGNGDFGINSSLGSLTAATTNTTNEWATESFEGGTISYDKYGSYSINYANNDVKGYDANTGISYSANYSKGISSMTVDGNTTMYDTIDQGKIEATKKTMEKYAKVGSVALGLLAGPAGAVVGWFAGNAVYMATSPQDYAMLDALGKGMLDVTIGDTTYDLSDMASSLSVSGLQGSTPEEGTSTTGGGDSINTINLTQDDIANLNNGGSLQTTVGSDGTVTGTTTAQTLYEKYGKDITSAQVSMEALQFAMDQQTAWNEIYGDVQQNLSDYYNSLDPDSYAAKSVQEIQTAYQEQVKVLDQEMAQRGLSSSGLTAQSLTQLSAATASQKAAARTTAEETVAGLQTQFLNTGIQQQAALSGGVSSAYNTLASSLSQSENLATQQQIASDANKSAEQNALLATTGSLMGLIFG